VVNEVLQAQQESFVNEILPSKKVVAISFRKITQNFSDFETACTSACGKWIFWP
jgi:hypothetical protein